MATPINFEFRAQNNADSAFRSFDAALEKTRLNVQKLNTELGSAFRTSTVQTSRFRRQVTGVNRELTQTTRLSRTAATNTRNFGRGFGSAGRSAAGFAGPLRQIASAVPGVQLGLAGLTLAALGTGRAFIRAADDFTRFRSQIRTVIPAGQNVAQEMNNIRIAANNSLATLDSSILLYQRLGQALQGTGAQLRGITQARLVETINRTIAISSSTTQEAEGAIRQFTQALGNNRLSGQEFNSVVEQANFLAVQLARGLGLTISQLREFGQAGLVGTQEIIDALIAQSGEIDDVFSRINRTTQQSARIVANNLSAFLDQLSENIGAQQGVVALLEAIAEAIDKLREAAGGLPSTEEGLAELLAEDTARLTEIVGNIGTVPAPSDRARQNVQRYRDLYDDLQVAVTAAENAYDSFQAAVGEGQRDFFQLMLRYAEEEERRIIDIFSNAGVNIRQLTADAALVDAFDAQDVGELERANDRLDAALLERNRLQDSGSRRVRQRAANEVRAAEAAVEALEAEKAAIEDRNIAVNEGLELIRLTLRERQVRQASDRALAEAQQAYLAGQQEEITREGQAYQIALQRSAIRTLEVRLAGELTEEERKTAEERLRQAQFQLQFVIDKTNEVKLTEAQLATQRLIQAVEEEIASILGLKTAEEIKYEATVRQIAAIKLATKEIDQDQYDLIIASLNVDKEVMRAKEEAYALVGLTTEAEKLYQAEVVKVLNSLLAAGLIDQDRYNLAVEKLKITKEELAAQREETEIQNAVYRSARLLTPEEKARTDEVVRRLRAQQESLGLTDRELEAAIERARATRGLGRDTEATIRDAVIDGLRQGFQSNDWQDLAVTILSDVLQQAFRNSESEGVGARGFFRNLFSFGGGRARGGPVSRNVGYLVGENGPEYLIPGQNGFVAPLQNSIAGGRAVVNNYTTVNVAGSDYGRDWDNQLLLKASNVAAAYEDQVNRTAERL